MNVERLHAIARALREEFDSTQTPQQLQALVSALQSMVQEPNQPAYQQQVSDTRTNLAGVLLDANSNDFPETWNQVLEEIGIADLLGERLGRQIEEVFKRNEITPSAAAAELQPLVEQVGRIDGALNELLDGLEFFRIGSEELEPGDFEIGFLVPRAEVHEELGELGVEFQNLKRVLEPFMELATGSRPPIRVRTIASSEFQVFLESTPLMALLFTKALKTVLETYDKLLDIRLKRRELQDGGVPEEALSGIETYAETLMSAAIDDVVDELIDEGTVQNAGRRNELRVELVKGLNALANRIDRGYSVEVRAGELPEPAAEDDEAGDGEQQKDEVASEIRRAAALIHENRKALQFLNLSGDPILGLPEISDESDDDQRAPEVG